MFSTISMWAQKVWNSQQFLLYGFTQYIKLSASPIALEDRNVIILEAGILVSNRGPTQTSVRFGNLTYLKCNILNLELIDHEKYKQLLIHPEASVEPFDTLWKNNAVLNAPFFVLVDFQAWIPARHTIKYLAFNTDRHDSSFILSTGN